MQVWDDTETLEGGTYILKRLYADLPIANDTLTLAGKYVVDSSPAGYLDVSLASNDQGSFYVRPKAMVFQMSTFSTEVVPLKTGVASITMVPRDEYNNSLSEDPDAGLWNLPAIYLCSLSLDCRLRR